MLEIIYSLKREKAREVKFTYNLKDHMVSVGSFSWSSKAIAFQGLRSLHGKTSSFIRSSEVWRQRDWLLSGRQHDRITLNDRRLSNSRAITVTYPKPYLEISRDMAIRRLMSK